MLAIRFTRVGKAKKPTYRVIISEKNKDPWGNFLELLGSYNPHTKEAQLNAERIQYWIKCGAQPSESAFNLFVRQGIITGAKKKAVKISKKRQVKLDKAKAKKEQQ
jgi:small subunit ribosomal protein S16